MIKGIALEVILSTNNKQSKEKQQKKFCSAPTSVGFKDLSKRLLL